MKHPVMTLDLAHRIEQTEIDYSLSRLKGMQAAEGNPLSITVECFHGATALLIKEWPDFWYGNKVVGLSASSGSCLDEIVSLFNRDSLSFRFEMTPAQLNTGLGTQLHKLGFFQSGFSAVLYGQPYTGIQAFNHPDIQIEKIDPDVTAEAFIFLDLYQKSFQYKLLTSLEKEVVMGWLIKEKSRLNLYIVYVAGEPAGVGVLHINGGIGLLADAATLPEFRGRGCQTALLHHRIDQAGRKNCDLVTSFVEFGGGSHRNIERAGLKVAYTKSLWTSVE